MGFVVVPGKTGVVAVEVGVVIGISQRHSIELRVAGGVSTAKEGGGFVGVAREFPAAVRVLIEVTESTAITKALRHVVAKEYLAGGGGEFGSVRQLFFLREPAGEFVR